MALPPSSAGAAKVTVAVVLPALAATPVGAPGGVAVTFQFVVSLDSTPSQKTFVPTSGAQPGTTAMEGADAALGPTPFVATTVKV